MAYFLGVYPILGILLHRRALYSFGNQHGLQLGFVLLVKRNIFFFAKLWAVFHFSSNLLIAFDDRFDNFAVLFLSHVFTPFALLMYEL
jgi:hypothetical protein